MDFKKIWKIYKDAVFFIDPEGFDHWWSLNWLERAQFDNENVHNGFIPYNVEDNLNYTPKVAFGINYIIASMFNLNEQDNEKDKDSSLVAEIYKVEELKEYFGEDFDTLIKGLEDAGVHFLYNDKQTKICFY